MDDTRDIKTIFSVNAVSIISDTNNETEGEASVGYEYKLDTSLPELAFALAGFLKAMENDADIKIAIDAKNSVGEAFIDLIHLYYTKVE